MPKITLSSTQTVYGKHTCNAADPNFLMLPANPLRKVVHILTAGTNIALSANATDISGGPNAYIMKSNVPTDLFTTDEIWLAAAAVTSALVFWSEESYA